MKHLFLMLVLCTSQWAYGQKKIEKNDFIAMYKEQFLNNFCQPDQFARACFNYDYQQCVKITKTHLSECLVSMSIDMPKFITSREEAGKWGGIIGRCAGKNFGQKQTKDANVTAQCVSVVGEVMAKKLEGE